MRAGTLGSSTAADVTTLSSDSVTTNAVLGERAVPGERAVLGERADPCGECNGSGDISG
jgi:hypothetical protein